MSSGVTLDHEEERRIEQVADNAYLSGETVTEASMIMYPKDSTWRNSARI